MPEVRCHRHDILLLLGGDGEDLEICFRLQDLQVLHGQLLVPVHLVRDNNRRQLGKARLELLQLISKILEILPRLPRCLGSLQDPPENINHVQKRAGPLNVPQKGVPEPKILMSSLDKTWYVGHGHLVEIAKLHGS